MEGIIAVKTVDTKQDSFIHGTYNGIEIISRKSDGYVNASKMVQVLRGAKEDTQFRRFLRENKSWKEYLDAFKEDFYLDEKVQIEKRPDLIEKWQNCYAPKYRGTYVHPKLINYIAIWASPKYAIYVGDIMDQINDKVHEKLDEQDKEDTPENAIEALNSVVEPLFNVKAQASRESGCWGYRDSASKLDQWEKEDYTRELEDKNKELAIKTKELEDLQKYVDSLTLNIKVIKKLLDP